MRPQLSTIDTRPIKKHISYTTYFNTFGVVFLIIIIYFFYNVYIDRKRINSF